MLNTKAEHTHTHLCCDNHAQASQLHCLQLGGGPGVWGLFILQLYLRHACAHTHLQSHCAKKKNPELHHQACVLCTIFLLLKSKRTHPHTSMSHLTVKDSHIKGWNKLLFVGENGSLQDCTFLSVCACVWLEESNPAQRSRLSGNSKAHASRAREQARTLKHTQRFTRNPPDGTNSNPFEQIKAGLFARQQ